MLIFFLLGAVLGGLAGFFACALLTAGKHDDLLSELSHSRMRLDEWERIAKANLAELQYLHGKLQQWKETT